MRRRCAPRSRGKAIAYEGPEQLVLQLRPLGDEAGYANLVGNALKYGDAARLTLEARPNQGAVLILDDDGPGIPESALRRRCSSPFHRSRAAATARRAAPGLGLTIARSILRAHGGDVVLQNRPEGGLIAVASLPV
jgi:signal transduction histidine kinase